MLLISLASGAPEDPRRRGLYVDDGAGLIAEHLKADLHLQASELDTQLGGAALMITVERAEPGEAERLRQAWSLRPEDALLLIVAEPLGAELATGPPGASGVDGATRRRLETEVLRPRLKMEGPAAALSSTLTALSEARLERRARSKWTPPRENPSERLSTLAGVLAALALALGVGRRLIRAPSFDSTDPRR